MHALEDICLEILSKSCILFSHLGYVAKNMRNATLECILKVSVAENLVFRDWLQ